MSRQVDVLIVGGGMAGGFLAAALAGNDLSVLVLDGAPAPVMPTGEASLRVVALTEASQQMLAHTGVWAQLDPARVQPYRHMQVFDSDGTGQVAFDAAEAGAQALGWMVENDHLVAALHERLQAAAQVEWRSSCRVAAIDRQADGWQVTLADGESLHCRLLVGADGARSLVRDCANIFASHRDTGHRALVTTLATEIAHGDCARQWFMSDGPLAFLPLFGDGKRVSIVWSCVPARAQALAALSLEEFGQALTLASEGALGKVMPLTAPVSFPIVEQHAASYVGEQLALIGDAAHVVHPLAGQGINLGLLDAGVLAEEILCVQQKGQDIGQPACVQQLLARYQRRRRGHNLVVQQSMRGFQTLFAQQQPALRWLRNTGMQWVNGAAPIKRRLIEEALGRHGDLPAIARAPARPAV